MTLHVLELDAPRRDQGDRRRDRSGADAVRDLVQVGRHDRDDVAVQVVPRAAERRRALRRGHRPRHDARRARASGGCSRTTPRSAGATRRCRTSGSCCRADRRRRRAVLETAQEAAANCQRKDGNSGLWRDRARRAGAQRARQADVRGRRAAVLVRPVGRATGRRVDRQARRGILPIADEPLVDPGAYGPDRVFLHIAAGDEGNAGKVAALRKAGHPTITVRADGPPTSGGSSSLQFATAVAGWVLEIARSTSRTCRRPRTTPPRRSPRARRTSARAASTSRSPGSSLT